jgi:hypothetical protein
MDTTWFAVDACGHVAIFHSGEEGAVADDAPDVYEIFDDHFRPGELRWALERAKDWAWGEHRVKPFEWTSSDAKGVKSKHIGVSGFFIVAPGLEAWARERATQHGSSGLTDGHVWFRGSIDLAHFQWLHERPGRCMGCSHNGLLGIGERCRLYGIFEYDCPTYGHPPYERAEAPPAMPATLAMLRAIFKFPEKIPAFPFCFLAKPRLQPKEWLPSHLYGDEWVKEDGTPMIEREGVDEVRPNEEPDADHE